MKKAILILNFALGVFFSLSAQVLDVKYLIEYNESTSLYDCKIVIIDGKATEYPHRIQFNSQYTIVVPHGTTLKLEELHNPKVSNQFYTGTTPCLWEFGPKEIAPPTTPSLDYQTVFPELSPLSAFDNLWPGRTIILFSVSADVDPCENAIRPFDNATDPTSIEMPGGGDFRNGYFIGPGTQTYDGNLSNVYENYITKNDSLFLCPQECIILEPNLQCTNGPLIYEWSTGETTETIEVCPTESRTYYLLVKDTMDVVIDSVFVYAKIRPLSVQILGPSIICSGETTSLEYLYGGSWSISYSSMPNVVTYDNFGNVTGIYEGKVVFTFTSYNGICEPVDSDTIYVFGAPEIEFIGPDRLCIGSTSSVSSPVEGIWESSNPTVASIDAQTGEILGLAQGVTTFTLTNEITGCISSYLALIVDPVPTVYLENDTLCIGFTTYLSPSSGGTWTALNPEIATIDGNIISGKSFGNAAFTFTNAATGCVSDPVSINIGSSQTLVISGSDRICIGEVTTIEPSFGGTWTSSDETVAIIDNQGLITGIGAGEVTFSYLSDDSFCIIPSSEPVRVDGFPDVSVGATEICLSETMKLSPSTGIWVSSNPDIASVSSWSGTVTALAVGTATFTFTSNATGCTSTTEQVTILPSPFEQYYPLEICPGETGGLIMDYIGTWVSANPNVATVDQSTGVITGVSNGFTKLTFTDAITNCTAEVEVLIYEIPTLSFVGPDELCVGESSTLSPIGGGTWVSNDPSIATITSSGQVVALSTGQTSFTFTTFNGCSLIADDLVVLPASDPLCIVGTDDLESQIINIYPNPAKDFVNIESNSLIESVSIYTLGFEKLKEDVYRNGKNNVVFNTSDLSKGMYLIALKTKDNTYYKKIIII